MLNNPARLSAAKLFVLSLTCLATGVAFAQPRPPALVSLEENRREIRTAQIEWSIEAPKLTQIEGMKQGAGKKFMTTRLAEAEVVQVQRGDSDGVIIRGPDGAPSPVDQRPLQYLSVDADLWQNQAGSISATLRPQGSGYRPPDLRSLGVSPFFDANGLDMVLWFDGTGGPAAREYTESTDDGLHIVSAKTAYGKTTWWLDPQKGWNPVRVAAYDDKGIVMESRTTYSKVDDVWFPKTAALFSRDYKDGKEAAELITVHSVAVNRPDQPTRLGPQDIGVEAGVSVTKYGADFKPVGSFMFDGQSLVPVEEYSRRVKSGELKISQRVLSEEARLLELPQNAAAKRVTGEGNIDPWYRYTSLVIERFAFDADQIQKARLICDDCQQRRNAYLQAKADQLDAAQAAVAVARRAEPLNQSDVEKADQRLLELLSPVTQIFEKELKPRLDKLPTRSQRAATESREQAMSSREK